MARILLVDDDPAVLRLVSLVLRTEGLAVDTATDGNEAMRALRLERPDLIVLDLSMPVMDGRTFYRRARAAGYTGPMIVCSAYGAVEAGRELGAEAAIDKPFEPTELVSVINSLLQPTGGPSPR